MGGLWLILLIKWVTKCRVGVNTLSLLIHVIRMSFFSSIVTPTTSNEQDCLIWLLSWVKTCWGLCCMCEEWELCPLLYHTGTNIMQDGLIHPETCVNKQSTAQLYDLSLRGRCVCVCTGADCLCLYTVQWLRTSSLHFWVLIVLCSNRIIELYYVTGLVYSYVYQIYSFFYEPFNTTQIDLHFNY